TLGSVYRDPSSTVPTAGLLRGQTLPYGDSLLGTTTIRSATIGDISPIDARIDTRTDVMSPAQLGTLSSPVTSSVFGIASALSSTTNTMDGLAMPRSGLTGLPSTVTGRPGMATDDEMQERAPLSPATLGTPVDLLIGNQPLATYLDRRQGMGRESGSEEQMGGMRSVLSRREPRTSEPTDDDTEPTTPALARAIDPSVLPGYDVFGDMRMALALERDPGASWFKDAQNVLRARPELQDQLATIEDREAGDYAAQMLDQPLGSFVGKGQSALNDEMLKAEALMDIGHYFEAAGRYEIAERLDPGNPLPRLGHGHALLAAGEYSTAAVLIEQALSLFPDAARFHINLSDLMGGAEIVDVRRADLMKRLEANEDARLRFLLGYLEYHSGDHGRGLENLKKAAENASPTSIIARYPGLLEAGPDQNAPQPKPRRMRQQVEPERQRQSVFDEVVVPPPVDDESSAGQDTPGG
ncbi:MAG: tetratricopeptide repeat protein, partial [Phycisphaerae bacterium]|nr:tetratricopeptide repeat protein [Phycisphaerae bacterium]